MNIKSYAIFGAIFALTAFLVVRGINNYKIKTINLAYENNIVKIKDAITSSTTQWPDYFYSPLYSDTELDDYDLKPGKFFEEILKIKKSCGSSNGDCFAKKYKDEKGKTYTPEFKGACAVLQTGPVLCMIPQIKNENIKGIIDVNGQEGPNIFGKDLRPFEIDAQKRNYDPDDVKIEAVKTYEADN